MFQHLPEYPNRLLTKIFVLMCVMAGMTPLIGQDRETKVRKDKQRFEQDESWVYNNLEQGIAEAQKTGKPLLVIFRCIPCEACSEFDEQVVRRDPVIKTQMDKFVCVRIVQANGMDLTQFQFDYDQSLHVFMMNADKTIYGRFGTRSESRDESQDMTVEGFAHALKKALALHQDYPRNKALFQNKTGPVKTIKVPEDFPKLKGRYTAKLDYQGQVVKSCIHCHQIRESERNIFRAQGIAIPDQVLFPYPNPKLIGLTMDPQQAATVKSVAKDSPANEAGFRGGDEIEFINGQPILSIADFQWVLHQAPNSTELTTKIRRKNQTIEIVLPLAEGWKRRSDISWRASTWDLRRMGLGGIRFESISEDDRNRLKIAAGKLALRAKHVGQYNEHAVGKNAGFVNGDIIISVDESTTPMTESELLAYALNKKKPGAEISFQVLRQDKLQTMSFKTQ